MAEILYDAFFEVYTNIFVPEKVYDFSITKAICKDPETLEKLLPKEGEIVRQHKRFLQLKDIIIIAPPAYIKLARTYVMGDEESPANTPLYVDDLWMESEQCCCPQCQKDGVYRHIENSHFGGFVLRGNTTTKYIIPTDDPQKLTITEPLKKMLEEQPFKGYKITPIQDDEIQMESRLRSALHGKKLHLYLLGLQPDRTFPDSPLVCTKCGWDKGYCENDGVAFTCPNCKESGTLESRTLPSEETFPVRYCFVEDALRPDAKPLPAHNWDGRDFLGICPIISGRVARWLTENQIGPVCLCPYPTDVSRCTEQQRQAIEQIRFKHPHAVAPKISK